MLPHFHFDLLTLAPPVEPSRRQPTSARRAEQVHGVVDEHTVCACAQQPPAQLMRLPCLNSKHLVPPLSGGAGG